ncbi:MAG: hypothetical protein WC765_00710 [Phycisphaerae bacterium]|jgi:uncharacterized protein (TIGR02598 family)
MTLVEVVLAMGILVFAIVPVIGLLSISMKTSRESQSETAISLASRQVLGQLRMQTNFDLVAPAATTAYFTWDGTRQSTQGKETIFICDVVTAMPVDNPHFANVTMTFRWPAQSAPPVNVQIIQASLAEY